MESIPYDKRSGKIWFNGKTVEWKDANIHILNHGLHYASCVFEGERVYDGEIFKLEEHTERLFYSAKRMGIKVPYSQDEINSACKKIVNIQKVQNGYVRPLIWRGSEMMAISAQRNKIHVAIATWILFFCAEIAIISLPLQIKGLTYPLRTFCIFTIFLHASFISF